MKLETVSHFVSHMKQQVMSVVLFATFFASVGYYLPRIYLQYIDKTVYYQVISPVKVEQKVYTPCDNATVYFHRIALLDLHAKATINLFLISADGKAKYNQAFRDLVISKGEMTVTQFWSIQDQDGKCNIPTGVYYFEGVVDYPVSGIQKQTFFITETFQVKNTQNITQ